jgi:hypothetical protein
VFCKHEIIGSIPFSSNQKKRTHNSAVECIFDKDKVDSSNLSEFKTKKKRMKIKLNTIFNYQIIKKNQKIKNNNYCPSTNNFKNELNIIQIKDIKNKSKYQELNIKIINEKKRKIIREREKVILSFNKKRFKGQLI